MGLFQQSVLKKYLKEADQPAMKPAFEKFAGYFHNCVIQQNIRECKEEEYQDGFLTALFVNVFGFTLKPNPDFNLTREFKNEKGARKADGAILKEGAAIGVIELKSTTTKDLESIRLQAFDYKANQKNCVYVITSNFEKVRFYINNAVDFEEFDLFRLNSEQFQLMWLCLARENLLRGIPLAIKNESVVKEEDVTRKIYTDYSAFKRDLYNDLIQNNLYNGACSVAEIFSGKDEKEIKLLLFKKSQKLIDRFLFILFGEDRGLLPPNSISEILTQWEQLKELDEYKPLYDRFKKYFGYMNDGWKGKKYEIFAYNGGLFLPDEILDAVTISDEMLYKHTKTLTGYDFESEVDVNILGHIFENSLNEIEEVAAQIEGAEIDLKKSKRKKDGVFYTPKYITKYIVENTVGKLCSDKKAELEIDESEYQKSRKGRTTKKLKELDDKLTSYRNWMLTLTICDPACGSGAFLNQALDFLIREHRTIDELRAKLLEVPMVFTEVENSILENNIYGVDINEESIEIAKLSLWLRTAQKGRKLTSLSNNIKCGNSLIDDTAIAGEKAFHWSTEFPEVFAKGGFDVVIGNPPYVQLQSMGEMSDKLSKCGFVTFDKGADLYCIFIERGFKLLKPGGLQSFIMPNKWMLVEYGKPLRKFLSKTGLRQILNFGDIQFFEEATTYVCIFVTQNSQPLESVEVLSLNKKTYSGDFLTEVKNSTYNYPSSKFSDAEWSIQPYLDSIKLEKMKLNGIELKDLPVLIYRGILTGFNDAFYIDEATRNMLITADPKSNELIKPMVRGRDISAYGITGFEYLVGTFPALKLEIDNYPAIKNHLLSFGYDRLKQTGETGARKKTNGKWFETQDSINYFEEFSKPKILYPEITAFSPFMYDESGILANQKSFILTAKDNSVSLLFLTAVLNSSLAKLWIWYNCPELQGGTREIRKVYFEHFPVPKANDEQTAILAKCASERTSLTSDLQNIVLKFTRTVQRKFNLEDLSVKLQEWYLLSYPEYIKELAKKRIKLSLSDEAEWEDYFTGQKQKAQTLKAEIDKTDREIDRMVYELYGLTEEEVGIVEGSIK
ncbi:MAG: n-6 DNA [Prolixibacteraceae bacterium]|nr:MAG: n-6 DNA [Prolixibacteraceae bacterium]